MIENFPCIRSGVTLSAGVSAGCGGVKLTPPGPSVRIFFLYNSSGGVIVSGDVSKVWAGCLIVLSPPFPFHIHENLSLKLARLISKA